MFISERSLFMHRSYIIDCLDAGYKLPLRGFYFLSISNTTRRIMKGQLDPFGDR